MDPRRQAAGADPEETAARLLAWIDDDPYGFSHRAASSDEGGWQAQAARRRWAEALRALYEARRNVNAYVRLAEDTGVTASDCLGVAT